MQYFVHFSGVRTGPHDGVQLGAIVLFDRASQPLAISDVSNPGGDSPFRERVQQLVAYQDAGVDVLTATGEQLAQQAKWYDGSFGAYGESTLRLKLPSAAMVVHYDLFTARDRPQRDPTAWDFGVVHADGTFSVLSSVTGVTPPVDRKAPYDSGAWRHRHRRRWR